MIKQKNLDVDKQKLIQNVLQNFGAFVRLKNAKERRYARALSHVLENKPVQQQLQEQLEQLEAKKRMRKLYWSTTNWKNRRGKKTMTED